MISRRSVLAGLALGAAFPFRAASQPVFSAAGPNADHYGAADGYPVPGAWRVRLHGNPFEPAWRVGAFSHIDEIFRTRTVARAQTPWMFKRQDISLAYPIDDYLGRTPVTGLVIARDDTILVERYQYGRTDRDRMLSQSMVKSITGLLVGAAVADGAIRSLDDTPATYEPGFAGSEYGRTPLRDLLRMSSGVDFGEERDDGRDLNRLWRDMVVGRLFGLGPAKGTVASLVQFNQRVAAPGARFQYASIEPDVLGAVLQAALHRTASDYLGEKIWQPIGTEADAVWALDAERREIMHFGFAAVLRDYARLGRLLAWDGAWEGRQVLSSLWLREATTVGADYLAPGRAMAHFGYGYLFWLLPGPRRQFAMVGSNGQRLCVDPALKLVMVQTALEDTPEAWRLWAAIVKQFA
jgi:CubicO group peptidase (beta-lactamase class C family)